MRKQISKLADSLNRLGETPVTKRDFMAFLNTDIRKLEITRSLRRLGGIQVMEWDFRTALLAVKKTAAQEVDVIKLVKRTAQYKILDWDFRNALPAARKPAPHAPAKPPEKALSRAELQAISARLKNFLQYVVVNLIDEPHYAQIKVKAMGPTCLRFKLVLVQRDVAMLIGREGFTASAIRHILQAIAAMNGVQALLQIHSHEEETALVAKEKMLLGSTRHNPD